MKIDRFSYSSLTDWQKCPYFFKLCHIDGLKEYKDTIWTHYGTLVHRFVQDVLDGKYEDPMDAAKKMNRIWLRFCRLYKESLLEQTDGKDPRPLSIAAGRSIVGIYHELKKEFGNFKVLAIEEEILMPVSDKWPHNFKGFIDIVIETEDGKILIIDFKTAKSAYLFVKFKDKFKEYQLTLYKSFYCRKHNIDPKNVETYFVVLEKNEKSKAPIKLVRTTSGATKVKNALEWLDSAIAAVEAGRFLKNKRSCLKYGEAYPCEFYKTPHCSA